jgi:hypothetical protein
MKKFKRLICLVIVFLLTASVIAGCALVERDLDYFNNRIVATVGPDIVIRKSQLVNAFNSQGRQHVAQGMTVREAVERTLDELVDREILAELSIQQFSFHLLPSQANALRGGLGLDSLHYMALYESEKAEVRRDVFGALDEYFVQLQDRVRDERNLVFETTGGGEDPNLVAPIVAMDPFRPYTPLVRRNQATQTVAANTIFTMDISAQTGREFLLDENIPLMWSPDIDVRGDSIVEMVKTEALVRLVRVLTNNERGLRNQNMAVASLVEDQKDRNGESILTNGERALIGRELARMIEEQSKTLLIRRFQDIFELGIDSPIDRSNFARVEDYEAAILDSIRASGGHRPTCVLNGIRPNPFCNGCEDVRSIRATRLARQAEAFYRSQILMQHNRFVRGLDTVNSLSNSVIDGISDRYWLPTEVANSHFTVSHILIQYDDDQTAEFERLKAEFEQGGTVTAENYNARLQALAGNLTVRARDKDGVEHGPAKTALQVRDEIISAIGGTEVLVEQPGGQFTMMMPDTSAMTEEQQRIEEQRRINIFRDFIYMYNQDPGMMNAEFEYVIGVENSRMVPQFTAASRELFGYKQVARKQGNEYVFDHEGNVLVDWELNTGFTPQRSSMTFDLVMTDFGAHIVMYTRTLSDFIYHTAVPNNVDLRLVDFPGFERGVNSMLAGLSGTNFLFAPLTSYGDQFGQYMFPHGTPPLNAPAKAWFDVAVERMNQPIFENLRSTLIMNFRNARVGGEEGRLANPVRHYRSNFRDMWR